MREQFHFNFDFLSDWTVKGVHFTYRLLVQNTYFILSNFLFLIALFFFRLTMNNFVLFILPFFFLFVSFSAGFRVMETGKELPFVRQYVRFYVDSLKDNWRIFLFYTGVLAILVYDMQVLLYLKAESLLIPLFLTGSFLFSSMFFTFLILTDPRSKKIAFRKKIFSALLLSYKLPFVTFMNLLYCVMAVFIIQNFSLAYLCFFGGLINYSIHSNLKRRFSVQLYITQILEEKE